MRQQRSALGHLRRTVTLGVAALAAVVIVTGRGGDDDDSADATTTQATTEQAAPPGTTAPAEPSGPPPGCEAIPAALRTSLTDSLKGNRTLGQAYGVQTDEEFGLRGIAEGAWFVTGDVRPNPGLSTWIVGDDAFTTGGGLIIGVSPSARAASTAGDLVSLDAIGVAESSEGYEESVACFGKG